MVSVFSFCATPKITSVAPFSISSHFQTLYHCLLLFQRTLVSIFYLSPAPKPRVLHSSGFHLLSVSKVKTRVGTFTFSVAVPTI